MPDDDRSINPVDGTALMPPADSNALLLGNGDSMSVGKICFRCMCYVGVLMLILLPAVSVAMIKIAFNGSHDTVFTKAAWNADILLITTYIVSFIGIIMYYDGGKGQQPNIQQNQEKYSPISIVFIFILGFGDSLCNLTRTIDQILLALNANSDCSHYVWTSVAENLLKSVYQLCLLMFIIDRIIKKAKPSSQLHKIFILGLSGSSVCQWLLLLFQEIDHDHRDNDVCISNTSGSETLFKAIEPFIYPLGLEFRASIVIELLILSHFGCKEIKELFCCCCKEQCGCPKISCPTMTYRKIFCHTMKQCGKSFLFIAVPALGILVVSAALVFVFFQESNISNNAHGFTLMRNITNEQITFGSEVCEGILALIISILTAWSMLELWCCQNSPNRKKIHKEFWIDFVVLCLVWIWLLAYCCYTWHGAAHYKNTDGLQKHIKGLTIAASAIPIFQTLSQAIVIILVAKTSKCLSNVTIYLWIIFSFAIWLFDTFSAKEFATNNIQTVCYGHEKWEEINAILVPMAIFFRFHTCIIFANIKDEVYWE